MARGRGRNLSYRGPKHRAADRVPAIFHGIGIIGFSNGGAGAVYAQEELCNRGIKVDVVLTAEPIPQGAAMFSPLTVLQRTKNTGRLDNYCQKVDAWLKGWEVKDADTNTEWDKSHLGDSHQHAEVAVKLWRDGKIRDFADAVPESRPHYIHQGPCK